MKTHRLGLKNSPRAFEHSLLQRVIVSSIEASLEDAATSDTNGVENDEPAIRIGDVIISINGDAVGGWSGDAVGDALNDEQDGTELVLTLLRKPMPMLPNDQLIVCATEQRTHVVLAAALAMCQPYLPFRAVFVEGELVSTQF